METLELNQYGLTEMNASEMTGVDGGIVPIIAYLIASELVSIAAIGLTTGYIINN